MEIFTALTAADGYKTLTTDIGSDPVVSVDAVRSGTVCGVLSVFRR